MSEFNAKFFEGAAELKSSKGFRRNILYVQFYFPAPVRPGAGTFFTFSAISLGRTPA